jgi:hypothetical protein
MMSSIVLYVTLGLHEMADCQEWPSGQPGNDPIAACESWGARMERSPTLAPAAAPRGQAAPHIAERRSAAVAPVAARIHPATTMDDWKDKKWMTPRRCGADCASNSSACVERLG